MKNNVTEILGHDISWFVDADSIKELDESSIEHIEKLIKDGYTQGSLSICYGKFGSTKDQKETSGYWHIINWKNIALELYNVTGSEVNAQKARKLFDENWN